VSRKQQQHLLRCLAIFFAALCFGTVKMMAVEKHSSNWSAIVIYLLLACEILLMAFAAVLAFLVRLDKYDV